MQVNVDKKLTPMMEQWHAAKRAHPDAVLLFRMGDFYELFDQDAVVAAPILELALTCRDKDKNGMKMAGFPFHAADAYIEKLVDHGFKVAICEQLEDPKHAKGVVKRGITNVVTPGTALIGEGLEHSEPTYLVALRAHGDAFALAALDLQSGLFSVCECSNSEEIVGEMMRLAPREVVVSRDDECAMVIANSYKARVSQSFPLRIESRAAHATHLDDAKENISLSAIERDATNSLLHYLKELKGKIFSHIGLPRRYAINDQLLMDDATRSNLDLLPKRKGDQHNLFALLNKTKTIPGRRALYQAIIAPSTSRMNIIERLDVVGELYDAPMRRSQIRDALSGFFDLEKLTALACAERISPRGLANIRSCLDVVQKIREMHVPLKGLKRIIDSLPDISHLHDVLSKAIVDAPPLNIRDGGVLREGYDAELDAVVMLINNGKDLLLALENREREQTRIASLKIKYTRVFGYYIEITKTHLEKVPSHYQRKQTIANGERYVTAELVDLETRLSSAEETACTIIERRFTELVNLVIESAPVLKTISQIIAQLDLLANFAELAVALSWVRPEVLEQSARKIDIVEGRHPLIEALLQKDGSCFTANDVLLDKDEQSIILITGPNMAGKSTIMRQVALIQIMTQMGCFVPAHRACVSLCDAIFARVGASDDPAKGRSTFMVEMAEAAAILSNATEKSLIILDEIGRGTSTYDGMSIAQAIGEYLHDQIGARTLFATHYHELTELQASLKRLKNFHVSVEERDQKIRFLYALRPGPCLQSFGVEVARLSGLPESVLDRACVILKSLESKRTIAHVDVAPKLPPIMVPQMDLFKTEASAKHDVVAHQLLSIDVNRLTPLQALNKIASWQNVLRKKARVDGCL